MSPLIAPSHSVLLIQDDALLAEVTGQLLRKAPGARYSLTHRADLEEALELLRGGDFDAILLDLALAEASDLTPLRRVLAAAPEVPVVVLTSTPNYPAAAQAIKLGAQDFLVKGDFNFLSLDRAILYAIERQGLRRTVAQLAVIDELTGLYNRRGYNALAPGQVARVRGAGARGFLCCFDLDRFKAINDELGHPKGDEALVEFAAHLRSVFPKDTLLARLGGDEFLALGLERSPGAADEAVNTLTVVLSVRNSAGGPFPLEASAGMAHFDAGGEGRIDEIIAAADAALYRDKEARSRARRRPPLSVARL